MLKYKEPTIQEMLRIHAETLGKNKKPASRQLLIEAANEIDILKKTIELLKGTNMTPEQRIKRHILKEAIECNDDFNWDGEITADNVDEVWDILVGKDLHWDFVSEFRGSGEDTGLPSEYSRHYEAKEKARKLSDGTWVGWTYWYGGGKHGEPESIDWMSEAYEIEVHQETRIINVFKKRDT